MPIQRHEIDFERLDEKTLDAWRKLPPAVVSEASRA